MSAMFMFQVLAVPEGASGSHYESAVYAMPPDHQVMRGWQLTTDSEGNARIVVCWANTDAQLSELGEEAL